MPPEAPQKSTTSITEMKEQDKKKKRDRRERRERNRYKYQCVDCDREYHLERELYEHMETTGHGDPKPNRKRKIEALWKKKSETNPVHTSRNLLNNNMPRERYNRSIPGVYNHFPIPIPGINPHLVEHNKSKNPKHKPLAFREEEIIKHIKQNHKNGKKLKSEDGKGPIYKTASSAASLYTDDYF
eukprot:UN30673